MRETQITIVAQGVVKLYGSGTGYCVLGNSDSVTFYIDVTERAGVADNGQDWKTKCPQAILEDGDDEQVTIIEFPEFPGWHIHSARGGKTISIALVRDAAVGDE